MITEHTHQGHCETYPCPETRVTATGQRCAEGSPVSFLLIQQSEDPRLAGAPDAIFYYGPDAVEMEDVPSWLRGA